MEDVPLEVKTSASRPAKKKVKRQLRHSNWLITVNPNQKFYGTEENYEREAKKLGDVVTEVLSDAKNFHLLFPLKEKAIEEGAAHNPKYFSSISASVGIPELGPKTGKLHIHNTIKVSHYTMISLDPLYLQKAIAEKLGKGNVYLNFKLIPSYEKNVDEYIHKEIQKYRDNI